MLNTPEYLMMRREAITNDGFTPSADPSQPGYAPDLFIWDTTRETNFAKMMLGNNAHSYNGQVGFSGGSPNIQFFLSSGFNKEGTVFSGNMGTERISFSNNIKYINENKKLFASLSTSYSNLKSNLINASISTFLSLPPNAPPLYRTDGKMNWEEKGYYFDNPMAYLHKKYAAATDNLLSNLQLEYKILKGLSIRSSFGYNSMQISEKSTVPIASQIPIYNPTGMLSVSENSYKSWIIEPQAEYEIKIGRGELKILIGSTFSQNKQTSFSVDAQGYQSDNLLNSLTAATALTNNNSFSHYKYTALFGRINYNWNQKYIINVTGRRDGSSRFGPDKRFANFGAIGTGWVFNRERFIKNILPFLSFGKIRSSYGLTGNDQIGNYKYLDAWSINNYAYQGGSALYPAWLYNPLYGWETNKKFEVALDIGLFNDRVFLSSAYYNNRSGNQLVAYDLTRQTGFTDIVRNFPAIVQNQGIEFQLNSTPIITNNFKWLINANITIPSNKLLSYKDLASSSYSGMYVEGKSLNLIYKYSSLGVDSTTGAFRFEDINKDNTISRPQDLSISGSTDPQYYGGIRNTFTFNAFELDIFFDFKKQTGLNYLNSIYSSFGIPGYALNQPKYVLDRWEEPGDITEIQRFTTITYSAAYMSKENLRYSNAIYSNASFLRLKTATISWQIPATIFRKVKMYNSQLFVSAQNIFTISNYKGNDPETQNFYSLPPLRKIVVGINLNF
jgi:TonB-linked SusC/RagA family outer membrane protein